jgi:hypothetical protein
MLAVLADIELVTLHRRPVTRRRRLDLTGEPRDAPDDVARELVAIKDV